PPQGNEESPPAGTASFVRTNHFSVLFSRPLRASARALRGRVGVGVASLSSAGIQLRGVACAPTQGMRSPPPYPPPSRRVPLSGIGTQGEATFGKPKTAWRR